MASDFEKLNRDFESSFAALLKGTQTLNDILARRPGESPELRPQLEAALWLHQKRDALDPMPGYVRASKARLLAHIEAEKAYPKQPPLSTQASIFDQIKKVLLSPRFAMQFAVVLVLGCLFALTSVMGLSVINASQPGEYLYPAKQAYENGRLVLSVTSTGDARLHTRYAERRLLELQGLILDAKYAYIEPTIGGYGYHASSAYESIRLVAGRSLDQAKTLAGELSQTISNQQTTLMVLTETLPTQAREQAALALEISDQVVLASNQVLTAADTRFLQTPAPVFGGMAAFTSTPTNQPSSTFSLTPTPVPTLTTQPSDTIQLMPTIDLSSATPSLMPSATPIPLRTATPAGDTAPDPTDEPKPLTEPTDKPTDEPEPEPTKKPLPDPTRRPPKPTKDPK